MGHLRVGGCQHSQQAPILSPPAASFSVTKGVTMNSSACTPRKRVSPCEIRAPAQEGREEDGAGVSGRDGYEDSGDKMWGWRDWGTHGGCLPSRRAVFLGKEGWVVWWAGDGSPHNFDQQVSPGCTAVSCSVSPLPHSCLVPVLHPSHPPTTPAPSPPSFLNQPHPTGG